MSFVTARLQGGLGNQMFTAAAAKLLARRLGAELRFDISAYSEDSLRKFGLSQFEEFAHVPLTTDSFSIVKRSVDFAKKKLKLSNKSLYRQNTFDFDEKFFSATDFSRISGLFQNWRYFAGNEGLVRSMFKANTKTSLSDESLLPEDGNYLALHLRRADYTEAKNLSIHGLCDVNYYLRACDLIERLLGESIPIVAFTDERGDLPLEIKKLTWRIINPSSELSEVQTLHAMATARAIVTANSSFSWWGAYLGDRPNRPVVTPRPWRVQDDFAGSELILPHWYSLGIGRTERLP